MTTRTQFDAIVVGGGIVGCSAVLALAQSGLKTLHIDHRPAPSWKEDQPDVKLYAIAPDSVAFFETLGVWQSIRNARVQAYQRMVVWDAAGAEELAFNAAELGAPALGWIIESTLLIDRLRAQIQTRGIDCLCPAKVVSLECDDHQAKIRLDDGQRLSARLIVAADGRTSALRSMAKIAVSTRPYGHQAIMALIQTERPHEATAWQRFITTGPFAVLPWSQGQSAIVWTVPDANAYWLIEQEEAVFNQFQTNAFGARLGAMQLKSQRYSFPLVRQLAQRYLNGRVVLVGDAAHVVHPLAGQGVNLGLRDVERLHASVVRALSRGVDWSTPYQLQRWERQRRSEDTVAAMSFDAIHRLYSNDAVVPVLLRGALLGAAGHVSPLRYWLWRHAAGITPTRGLSIPALTRQGVTKSG